VGGRACRGAVESALAERSTHGASRPVLTGSAPTRGLVPHTCARILGALAFAELLWSEAASREGDARSFLAGPVAEREVGRWDAAVGMCLTAYDEASRLVVRGRGVGGSVCEVGEE
jgi:hypothetical protein